jgi:hypothetical protein
MAEQPNGRQPTFGKKVEVLRHWATTTLYYPGAVEVALEPGKGSASRADINSKKGIVPAIPKLALLGMSLLQDTLSDLGSNKPGGSTAS